MIRKSIIAFAIIGVCSVISIVVVIVSLVRVFSVDLNTGPGCNFSIQQDLSDPQPLLLRPGGAYGHDAFFLPDDGGIITLSDNQLMNLACPDSSLVLNGISTGSESGTTQCSVGSFTSSGKTLPFSAITCTAVPNHVARYTGNTCLDRHREIEIGFIVGNRFLRHILICLDDCLQNTLYSQFNLTRAIAGFQVGYPRSDWIEGSFYNLGTNELNTLYTINQQRITINNLLGLDVASQKYIAQNMYLSRGHLTAKADFIYGAQQNLTFYFINAAPQWQSFNGGNWNSLEGDVRNFASTRSLDLIVYTGTYGVTTLPHEITTENISLFLHVDDYIRGIPVPRLYWKVLYEPISKAGIAFLGVNNPHIFQADRDIICTDICSTYDWLTWDARNTTLGYSYCCSIDDFRKAVTTLPDFEVVQLLV